MSTDKITKGKFKTWKDELEKLLEEMTEEAKLMVEDYTNNPTKMSGSITQIHEDSPLLKEKKDVD